LWIQVIGLEKEFAGVHLWRHDERLVQARHSEQQSRRDAREEAGQRQSNIAI
jgi:hypothetical protein